MLTDIIDLHSQMYEYRNQAPAPVTVNFKTDIADEFGLTGRLWDVSALNEWRDLRMTVQNVHSHLKRCVDEAE